MRDIAAPAPMSSPMNAFDSTILDAVNTCCRHATVFYKALVFLSDSHLLKGGVLALLFWWAWFRPAARTPLYQERLLATLVGCVVAIVLARALAYGLPFRVRPLHDPALGWIVPDGIAADNMEAWSSFPSDHAVLFFAWSTGLWWASRTAGVIALCHATLLICVPRLFLGVHYPTDLLAGAAMGVAVAIACNLWLARQRWVAAMAALSRTRPQWFYPALFFFTYQAADLFDDCRAILHAVAKLAHVGTM